MFSNNAVVDMTVTKTLDIMDKTPDISLFYFMLYIFQTRKNIIRISVLAVLLNQSFCVIWHAKLPLNLLKNNMGAKRTKKQIEVFTYWRYAYNANPKRMFNWLTFFCQFY